MGFTSWKGLFAYICSGPVVYAATPNTSGVHHAFSIATAVLYTVLGLVVTFVVWLVGHSFDVLAMISPFPFLDFLLKAVRNTIFAILAITALLSPKVGVLLSLGRHRVQLPGLRMGPAYGVLRNGLCVEPVALADTGGASEAESRRPSTDVHRASRQAPAAHLRAPVLI